MPELPDQPPPVPAPPAPTLGHAAPPPQTNAPARLPTAHLDAEWSEPPTWPKVIGWISISFGGLGTLLGLCVPLGPILQNMFLKGQEIPPTMQMDGFRLTLGLVAWPFSILLLCAGIACIRRKAITRWMHLLYALHGFISVPLNIRHEVQVLVEAKKWFAEHSTSKFANGHDSVGAQVAQMMGLLFALGFGLGYPIFTAFWFGVFKRRPIDLLRSSTSDDEDDD